MSSQSLRIEDIVVNESLTPSNYAKTFRHIGK